MFATRRQFLVNNLVITMKCAILAVFAVAVLINAQIPNPDFKCLSSIKLEYFESKLTCPEGTVCNSRNKGATSTIKAKMCIPPKEICDYSCDQNGSVLIGGVSMTCEDDQECNAGKTSCEVCVRKKCDRTQYKCFTEAGKENMFQMKGMNFTCPTDNVCNKDYEYPCQPCKSSDPSVPGNNNNDKSSIAEQSFFL